MRGSARDFALADSGDVRGVRAVLEVLAPRERRRIPRLVALMIVVAVLEFVGVGAFLPLASVLSDPQRVLGTPWGRALFDLTGASDPAQFAVRLGVALLILLVVKVALTAYSNYQSFRFSYDMQISASLRILRGLLAREYEFFLGSNSAVLLKNVTAEVQVFAGGVVIPALSALSQTLIILMVVAVLSWVSPGAALAAAGMITALTVLLYAAIQRRLTVWGKTREQRLGDLSRVAHQALIGVKAIKTMGGESLYVDEFRAHGLQYARSNTLYQTMAATPTLLIELVIFGGAVGVMLYYAANRLDVTQLIPTVVLFGAAAYRILPAARLLFSNIVTIRYSWDSVDVVRRAMREQGAEHFRPASTVAAVGPSPIAPLQEAIELRDLSYRYPTSDDRVLSDVRVRIPAGASVAFVGPSGAGKTTIIDLLLGLLLPESGEVRIDGVALAPNNRDAWFRQIGYVPQHPFIADTSLRANIAFGQPRELVDDARVLEAIRRASLGPLLQRMPKGLDTPLGESGSQLSGGERQRVAIARALYREPRVLILDEATSALDTATERQINDDVLSSTADLTRIIVSHRLSTVRGADELVLLERGRVVAKGSYEDLVAASSVFAEMDRVADHRMVAKAEQPT
jgi:ATP-binding cassette subfamily C protein